jgi:hypothetical protein
VLAILSADGRNTVDPGPTQVQRGSLTAIYVHVCNES